MRQIFDFTSGWSFHKGDIEVRNFGASHADRFPAAEWLKAGNNGIARAGYPEDDSWRRVNLPHDFVIENEFSQDANYVHGSLPVGIGWYRKEFRLPEEDKDRRIFAEFDGVFRNSSIWVNGHYAGSHLSGYTSFSWDITDICVYGETNAIAVRVDASEYELWSYEGGGIYRDVRIVKTAQVHVPYNGVWVRPELDEPANGSVESAQVHFELGMRNALYRAASGMVECELCKPDGSAAAAAQFEFAVAADDEDLMRFALDVANPILWDVDSPSLYTAAVRITIDGQVVDEIRQTFGFRHIRFDADTGFYLNGRNIKLKGTCCHQDHAAVGVAVPAGLQEWRVAKLKEMGSNAIRTSHNPPDPSLLEACDRLGMLVMDEQRMMGSSPEMLGQLESLIRRDRNHPSVIMWSLGNEEVMQRSEIAIRVFRRMQSLAHRLDPSRPTTYAMNAQWIEICDYYAAHDLRFDVFGSNYRSGQKSEHYDQFHQKHPDWPMLGSETGGMASTRGLYRHDQSGNYRLEIGTYGPCKNIQWTNPKREGFVSAYGETCTPWGYTVEETWKDCASRPFMAGTFLWTGFDYRGETFPYQWPSVITRYGIMDLCGFPKDIYYYLRAWWRTEEPMVHLFPHWDWPGHEGEEINVWSFSNCAEIELLLNGKSLGLKAMEPNGHLEWDVRYEPGTLEGRGYGADGSEIAAKTMKTPGRSQRILLARDDASAAPAADIVVVNATIVDAHGEWCQNASNTVTFEVSGAETIGVGNGNPVSLEPDKSDTRNAYCGVCQIILRRQEKRIDIAARSPGLEGGSLSLEAGDAAPRPRIYRSDTAAPASAGEKGEIDNLL